MCKIGFHSAMWKTEGVILRYVFGVFSVYAVWFLYTYETQTYIIAQIYTCYTISKSLET